METIAKITIRCFFLGMGLLLLWFFMYAAADEAMYEFHTQWFDITREQFATMHYCGMMFLKVICFAFFLFPYMACKWCGEN